MPSIATWMRECDEHWFLPIFGAYPHLSFHNARCHPVDLAQMDAPLEYDTVDLSAPTSLALVSDVTDTPLPQLSDLNPAVLHGLAPTGYAIHVPKGSGNVLSSGLEMVPPEHRNAWRMHTLGPGETLLSVGKHFGVTSAAIIAANNLKTQDAPEGDRLLIPAAVRVDAPVRKPVTTMAHRTPAAQHHGVTAVVAKGAPAKPAVAAPKLQQRPVAAGPKPQPKPATAPVSSAPPAVLLPSGK